MERVSGRSMCARACESSDKEHMEVAGQESRKNTYRLQRHRALDEGKRLLFFLLSVASNSQLWTTPVNNWPGERTATPGDWDYPSQRTLRGKARDQYKC